MDQFTGGVGYMGSGVHVECGTGRVWYSGSGVQGK